MRIKNQKDFWAGVMFIAFGLFFAGFGTQYTFGTGARMGPGYFPTALGVILMLLGLVVAISAIRQKATEEKVDKFAWSTLLLILGSVVLFGILLQPLGVVVSIFVMVCVASVASHEFHWISALINAIALILLSLGIFVYALKLQFPIWPTFFSGI
jgi:uncharacterized membrane protein YfcA